MFSIALFIASRFFSVSAWAYILWKACHKVYARADSKQKREAIEKAYTNVTPDEEPIWLQDNDLLSFLKSF